MIAYHRKAQTNSRHNPKLQIPNFHIPRQVFFSFSGESLNSSENAGWNGENLDIE